MTLPKRHIDYHFLLLKPLSSRIIFSPILPPGTMYSTPVAHFILKRSCLSPYTHVNEQVY